MEAGGKAWPESTPHFCDPRHPNAFQKSHPSRMRLLGDARVVHTVLIGGCPPSDRQPACLGKHYLVSAPCLSPWAVIE